MDGKRDRQTDRCMVRMSLMVRRGMYMYMYNTTV